MILFYLLILDEGGAIVAGSQVAIVPSSCGSFSSLTVALHRYITYALSANQRLEKKYVVILSKVEKTVVKNAIAAASQIGFVFLIATSKKKKAVAFYQGSHQ